jgi:hypothetical protein
MNDNRSVIDALGGISLIVVVGTLVAMLFR